MKTFFALIFFACIFSLLYINMQTQNAFLSDEDYVLPQIPELQRSALSESVFEKQDERETRVFDADTRSRYDYYFLYELLPLLFDESLRRDDFSIWQNVLSQGGSRTGVYRGLVLGERYYALEEQHERINEELISFIDAYAKKYLGAASLSDEAVLSGFHTVKRLIVERSLELSDEFSGEDFLIWYAMLSSDLAKQYAEALRLDLRKNESISYHHAWAISVSDEFIRSELIIKLNLVFDYLRKKSQTLEGLGPKDLKNSEDS